MMERGTIQILNDFPSEYLHNKRNVAVYLPHGYEDSDARFPVVYLHDGQSMFGTGWYADRTADRLISSGAVPPVILVAVDCNTQDRRREMCHDTPPQSRRMGRKGYVPCHSFDGEGLGVLYERFLIEEVKGYIDGHFRTKPEPENTAIAGSSMGGIVSFRIGMRHPDVFGKLGLLSPAIHWESDDFYNAMKKNNQKIWLDCGSAESYYVDNVRELARQCLGLGYVYGEDLLFYEEPGATHTAEYFGPRFAWALQWLFGKALTPVKAEILGRSTVSVGGHKTVFNTVVTCDNGLPYTDLRGTYTSNPEEMVSVFPDGQVWASHPGNTVVSYENGKVSAEKKIRVVNSLSEFVRIKIVATVPKSTPANAELTLHYFIYQSQPLVQLTDETWFGEISVPRDWEFDMFLSLDRDYNGPHVALKADGTRELWRVVAQENQELSLHVEQWYS